MKIIFANRRNCFLSPGGDTIQMLKTIAFLKKNIGIEAKICIDPAEIETDLEVEIVHIFNLQTIDDTLSIIEACKQSGKKTVLSTIYWDLSHYAFVYSIFLLTRDLRYINNWRLLKRIFIRAALLIKYMPIFKNTDGYATIKYREKRRYALLNVDMILPNSIEELHILSKEFKIDYAILAKKSFIIPNAVDTSLENVSVCDVFDHKSTLDNLVDFVLEVGRIDVNKNQYNVVRALFYHPEIPIVFVGNVNQKAIDQEYFLKLKKISEKRGNVYFVEHISQEEVFEYYKRAKVHVLPSFRESPGLSSLEAFYFGCEIVTSSSEFCPTNYYQFDQIAHNCNPYNYKSIKKAVLTAYRNPKNVIKNENYFDFYSYDNVSRLMNDVYEKLINK